MKKTKKKVLPDNDMLPEYNFAGKKAFEESIIMPIGRVIR
jgi:hypothetical protein